MGSGKIKAGSVSHHGAIPTPPPLRNVDVLFSFKYLDIHSNETFHVDLCPAGYLEKLLVRLRDISSLRLADFEFNRSSSLRNHGIEWIATSQPSGFSHLNAQLRANKAFQFSLSGNEHGRIHGLLLNGVFSVVWLDPRHNLYP